MDFGSPISLLLEDPESPGKQVTLTTTVAFSHAQHAHGLMYREEPLSMGEGMLFVYPAEGRRVFWMKNTMIPLEATWWSKDGVLQDDGNEMQPQTLDYHWSDTSHVQYGLEVAPNFLEANGLRHPGRVRIANMPEVRAKIEELGARRTGDSGRGDALLLQERASDEGERSDRAGIRSGKDLQATVLVPELQTRATVLPDEAPASSPLSPRRQCYEVVAPALLSRIEVLSSLNAAKRRPPAAGKMVTDSNLVQLERESTTRLRRILDRQFGREDGAQTAIGRAWKRFLRRRAFLRVVHVVRWVQLRWRFRKRLREFRERRKEDDFAGLIRALHASTAFRCGVIRRKHLLFRRSLSNLVGNLPVLSTAAYDAGAADQIQKACRLWLFRKRRRAAAVRLQTWFRYDVARRAAAQRGGLRVLFETAQVCVVHRQDSMQAYAGGFNFGLGPGSNGDEEEDLADADEEDAGPLGGGAASSSGWSSSTDADFIEGQRLLAELETSAGITVQRVFRTGAEYAQCLLESSESEASSVDEQAERRNRLYGGGGSKSRKEQLLRSGGGVSSMNFREAASRRGSRNAGDHGTASRALASSALSTSARGRPLKKQGSSSPPTNSTNLWNKAGRSGGRGNHRDDEGVKTSARSAGRKTLVRGATGSSSRLGDGSFSLGESVTFSSSPKSRGTKVEHSTQRNTAAKKRKTTIYADTTSRTSSNSRSFSTDDEDEEESLRRNTAWNEQRTQSTLFLADEDCGHSTSPSFTRTTKKFPRSLSFSPMKGGAAPRPGGFSAIKERDSHSRGSARRSSGASSLRSSARSSSGNADAHARGRESAERSSSGGRSSCDRGCGGGRDESKGFKKMKSVRIDEDENDYEPLRRSEGGGGSRPLSPSLREEQTPGTKPGSGRTSSATSRRGSWDIKQQASSSNSNSPVSQATSSFGSATSPRHQDGSRSPVQIVSDRELERMKERLREVPSMFAQLRPRHRQGDFWLSKVLDRDLTCSFTHREYKRNVFGGVHNKEEFLFPGYGAAARRARSTYREDGGVPVGKRLGTVMHGQESGSLVPGSLSKRARDASNLRTSLGGTPTTATRRNASRKTQFGQILSGQPPTGGTTTAAGGAIAAGGGAAAGAHDGNRFPVAYRQKQSKTIILFAEPEQCPRTVGEMRLQHGLFVPAAMGRLFFQALLNCFFTGGSGTGRGGGTAGGAGGAPTLGGIGFFGSGGPKSPGGLSARGQYKGGGAGGHLSAHVMQVPRVQFRRTPTRQSIRLFSKMRTIRRVPYPWQRELREDSWHSGREPLSCWRVHSLAAAAAPGSQPDPHSYVAACASSVNHPTFLEARQWPKFCSKDMILEEKDRLPAIITRHGPDRGVVLKLSHVMPLAFDEEGGHLSHLFRARLYRIRIEELKMDELCYLADVKAHVVDKRLYFLRFERHVPFQKMAVVPIPVSLVGVYGCPGQLKLRGSHVDLKMATIKCEIVGEEFPKPFLVDCSKLGDTGSRTPD
eukprot:g6994.t1